MADDPGPPTANGRPHASPGTRAAASSFMTFGDAAERAAFEKLVAAFAERAPDMRVTMIHVPGQSDYRRRLGVDFAAGTPADIVLLNYRRYASFAARGVLEPLGPYLQKSRIIKEADFYPEATTPFVWHGALMCIPQNLSSLVVYYNRDLFRSAGVPEPRDGWTWDDLPPRGARPHPRHRWRRPDRSLRLRHRGVPLPGRPLHLAERGRSRGQSPRTDSARARHARRPRGHPMVRQPPGEAPRRPQRGSREGREQREPLPQRALGHVSQQPARGADLPHGDGVRLGRGDIAHGQAAGGDPSR